MAEKLETNLSKRVNIIINKLKIRLLACYRILFGGWNNWAIIHITKPEMIHLISDEHFEVDVFYHGIQPYVFYKMIEGIKQDEADMLLRKAEFEYQALLLPDYDASNN